MVEQEGWAHLLVHHAVRKLMHQAACDQGLDPDRLSFTGCLRIVRRHLVSHAAFPPDQAAHATRVAVAEILTERLPPRRLRAFPARQTQAEQPQAQTPCPPVLAPAHPTSASSLRAEHA
jgi:hypothetical protein